MKFRSCCFLAGIFFSLNIIAQQKLPLAVDSFYKKAMTQIGPAHIAWVKNTAKEINVKKADAATIHALAQNYSKLIGKGVAEGDALEVLLRSAASVSIYRDVDQLLKKMEAVRMKKDTIKNSLTWLEKRRTTKLVISGYQVDSLKTRTGLKKNSKANAVKAPLAKVSGDAELDQLKQELEKKRDSVDELSEFTYLELQEAIDKKSKYEEAISNLLKKFSDTENTIIQNLK